VDLSRRAARGVALATLAVACVVVGPAPQLTRAFERTYAVALLEHEQETRRRRIPPSRSVRRAAPRPVRPVSGRP
jgi:hypothetical protein